MNPSAEELAGAIALLVDEPVGKVYAIDRDRPLVVHARASIEAVLRNFLTHLALRLAITARGIHKAEEGKDDPVTGAAESADWSSVEDGTRPHLHTVAKDGARIGLDQVGGAIERAGELVTSVSQTTRDRVRDLVRQAEEEGWSNDELADAIAEDGVFGDARAETIARTETADADVAGNLDRLEGVGRRHGQGMDDRAGLGVRRLRRDRRDDRRARRGVPRGRSAAHPNCRCDVLPVLADEDEE
jgi:hypothetical protein